MGFWGAGSLMCGLSHTVDELMRYRVLLGFGMGMEFPIGLVSRHRSSVGLRWPSKRIAALHRLPIRYVLAARCALRCAPMAARSLRHLIRDATLGRRPPEHARPGRSPAACVKMAVAPQTQEPGQGRRYEETRYMHTPDNGRRRFMRGALGAVALAVTAGPLRAQDWPERPISFICPWTAGGTGDQAMRALCVVAARVLGQPIGGDNRAGASGMIGVKALASAQPDGSTIGQIPISVTRFAQLGLLQADPRRDFTYIARTSGQTFGIAVPAQAPFRTLRDFAGHAKAHPGKLTYAHAGVGSATHVGMQEFALLAGIELHHVPYKGGAEALQSVLSGHVDALADSSSWAPHVQAGTLRLLATWGAQRAQRFQDTPTLKESGYDMVVDAPNGVGAPRGLPPAVTARLRAAFRQAVASAEFKAVIDRLDAPLMYLDGPDYEKYIHAAYQQESARIEKLRLREWQ